MLDLKALINLSQAYSPTGTAKYIHVCSHQELIWINNKIAEVLCGANGNELRK